MIWGNIVGCIMRELTALEIDQLDFSGRVPDLNMPAARQQSCASAKNQRNAKAVKMRALAKLPRRKQRGRIGVAQPA
jgi:hypothetical protein